MIRVTLSPPRLTLFDRHIHHGLIGLLGLALMAHDARDWRVWLSDLWHPEASP